MPSRSGGGAPGPSPGGRSDEALLAEQIAYYRARAPEYDEWWRRIGRYDHGPEENARWFAEVAEVRRAIDAAPVDGDVLELAAGTGLWTERLWPRARSLTCVDASPEALALNRRRCPDARVHHVVADLFTWQPDRRFDTVFFAFWLTHVPEARFEAFWRMVGRAIARGGAVVLLDSRYAPTSTAVDHRLGDRAESTRERRLNDGRSFRVVKVFHDAASLERRLRALGWRADLGETATHFLYGTCRPTGS